MDFLEMMHLEQHGADTFVGVGPEYPWGGLYGGQIVAQGLRAAAATVDPGLLVHSLHAYFIRRGDDTEPIRFEVDRLRNGRSFATRAVVARQSVGAILNMSASFHTDEGAAEAQTARSPAVPGPDELDTSGWSELFDRRFVPRRDRGDVTAWVRLTQELPDDPLLHACALAYVSDDLPTDAVMNQHPDTAPPEVDPYHEGFWSASLDHAIWFHRPTRHDAWLLHDFSCHGLINSRGLSLGHVFAADGVHVATIAQEVLLRRSKTGG